MHIVCLRIIVISLFTFFHTYTSSAQYTYTGLIDKGKTEKACTKSLDKILKTPDDVCTLYDASYSLLLLNNIKDLEHKKKFQNATKSLQYIQKAGKNYLKLNTKEKLKLAKCNLDSNAISLQEKSVYLSVLKLLSETQSIDEYLKFIKKHSDCKWFVSQATDSINKLVFDKVKYEDTKAAYLNFINEYPDSKEKTSAQQFYNDILEEEKLAEIREQQFPKKLDKEKLLFYINRFRERGCKCDPEYFEAVPPLQWDTTLEKVAQLHSDDMFTNNFFSHTGSDGRNPVDRTAAFNITFTGENIAYGKSMTEKEVIYRWMNSPGHCANIMRARKYLGIAKNGIYWTMLLR